MASGPRRVAGPVRLALVPLALLPLAWEAGSPAGRDPGVARATVAGSTEAAHPGGRSPAAVVEARASAAPGPSGGATPASHVLDPGLAPVRGSAAPAAFTPGRAPFAVRVGERSVPYRVLATVVVPGETLDVAAPATGGPYRLVHGDGVVEERSPGAWSWTAPARPGIVALEVRDAGGAGAVHLNVLVAHPRNSVRNGVLGGYRIGRYRETPLRGDPAYLPPRGFVEVRREDRDVLVAPHFTLGQFLCKQAGEPRYVSLSVPLLLKLEAVLEAVNDAGHAAPTLHVMSGFRTPAYNRAIGNTTDYSRHLWGDAADVFVDADADGDMDDLNGDGRADLADAHVLYDLVEGIERDGDVRAGGLGMYHRTSAHGPFVHVDARGYRARW